MPIFMDRHDMRGATAEAVAEAHRRDLAVQDKYGVKYMTYWYDEARSTGFCLVEAPDAATAALVHREAHGEIASDIIPVDLATVEAFLGASAIRAGRGQYRAGWMPDCARVLVTDIVGSTAMTVRLGDAASLELVRVHDALVRRALALHSGREVKHTGDGIMAAFDDVANAVRAGADIQRRFYGYNPKRPKACGCASVSTPASRSPSTTTSSASRSRWHFACAAKRRLTASWFPDSSANCQARTSRCSSPSASGG